jgi:hypothetical protein
MQREISLRNGDRMQFLEAFFLGTATLAVNGNGRAADRLWQMVQKLLVDAKAAQLGTEDLPCDPEPRDESEGT